MPDLSVGGQAVIEGVMMRSTDRVSTAVRRADGSIDVRNEDFIPISKRKKLFGLPIVRGAISFIEMLVIGIRSLNFSAEIAARDIEIQEGKATKDERRSKSTGIMLVATVVLALVLAVAIFFYLPLQFASLLEVRRDALVFNLVAGAIRVVMFLAYVWAISQFKDFRRIFEYHGAEHKSIWAYESGKDLTPRNADVFTTRHPRCGTSFIIIVAILAIIIYSISDTIYAQITGAPPTIHIRFLVHFSLLPLVAGGSYELLKLSGKTRDSAITRFFTAPGLWLQSMTTNEPSLDQLEVAIAALKNALRMEETAEQAAVEKK
jgi:uncharacterized protein YqhQ